MANQISVFDLKNSDDDLIANGILTDTTYRLIDENEREDNKEVKVFENGQLAFLATKEAAQKNLEKKIAIGAVDPASIYIQ